MKKASSQMFLFAPLDYRTITSPRKGAPCFRRYGREVWLQNRRFHFKKNKVRGGGGRIATHCAPVLKIYILLCEAEATI